MRAGTQAYSLVSSDESLPLDQDPNPGEKRSFRRAFISHNYARLSLFGISLLFFCSSVLILLYTSRLEPSDLQCAQKMSAPSPLTKDIDYEWLTFENDFFHKSIYRGSPTPELEKAWDELWNYGAFSVPDKMVPGLNKSSTGLRRVPEEKGGGVAGLLEGFHQIHCLNLIRQYTYRDQYDYSHLQSFDGTDSLIRKHVDHCIETLRKNLMCTADLTPYLIKLDPKRLTGEDPDFNTLHKCRKWDQVVEWAKSHEVFRGIDPKSAHAGHN